MSKNLVCWKCGASLKEVSLPFRRLEECPECNAELHVCRMCHNYKPSLITKCEHPTAGSVREKERSNFCSHFRPRPNAYGGRLDLQANRARTQLDALFGGKQSKELHRQIPMKPVPNWMSCSGRVINRRSD